MAREDLLHMVVLKDIRLPFTTVVMASLLITAPSFSEFAVANEKDKARKNLSLESSGSLRSLTLEPQRFLLAVGIDHFSDPLWQPLRFASKDAVDVHQAFTNGSNSFDSAQLLNSPKGVTKASILQALDRLEDNNRNEDDVVVLYLSTHGTVAYRENGRVGRFIITSDTQSQAVADTALDYDELIKKFKALQSRRKVLILAFCHSGIGKSVLTPAMKKSLAQLKGPYFEEPIYENSEGTMVLTASGWREPALEDPKLANDVYTHYLLKGFTEDVNGDGAVSITEAHSYAAVKTYNHTRGRQRPSAIVELLGADPILVSGEKQKSGDAVLYSLMRRFSGLLVSLDGIDKGTLEKGIRVPAGRSRLEFRDPQTKKIIANQTVNFKAGREYSVANILVPRFPNTFNLGIVHGRFEDAHLRRSYAPGPSTGYKISYIRDDGLDLSTLGQYNFGFDISYFPLIAEQIVADEFATFEQRRRMWQVSSYIGSSDTIASLTTANRAVVTEWQWEGGPSLLYFERSIDAAAIETPTKSRLAPGFKTQIAVGTTYPYYLLKVRLFTELAAFYSVADNAKDFVARGQAGLQVGMFW